MYSISLLTYPEVRETLKQETLSDILSDSELSVYESLQSAKRRRQWLAGRLGLKRLINQELHSGQVPLRTIEIKTRKNGQPYVDTKQHVSISHSDNVVVVALSEHQIGVDVEPVRSVPESVQSYYLTDKEKEMLRERFGNHGSVVGWTIKEAYLKSIGKGLRVHPKRIRIENKSAAMTIVDEYGDEVSVDINTSLEEGNCLSVVHNHD